MTDPKDSWKLDTLRLHYQDYGENKGKYIGKIKFSNGEEESFEFKITPEMAQRYFKLINKEIVKSAESLSSKLMKSLETINPHTP